MKTLVSVVLLAVCLSIVSDHVFAGEYRKITIDFPEVHGSSYGTDLNQNGEIVGRYYSSNGLEAFYWSKESGCIDIGTVFPNNVTDFLAINNHSQVAILSNGRLAIWSKTTGAVDYGYIGLGSTIGAMNDYGAVVGSYLTDSTRSLFRPFLWTQQKGMQFLELLPDVTSAMAYDINNIGQAIWLW